MLNNMESIMPKLKVKIGDLECSIDVPSLIETENNQYVESVNDEMSLKREFIDAQVHNVWRYEINVCEDDVRVIEHDESEFLESKFKDRRISETTNGNSILFILESPHKDEIVMHNNVLMPKGPAQGTTGIQMKKKLASVFRQNMSVLNLSGEYHLYIVNPVRMQASLFALHRMNLSNKLCLAIRDEIWKFMWINHPNYRSDFKALISQVQPCIIINACTANLKKFVNREIPENMQLFEVFHPSAWVYQNVADISIERLIWSGTYKTYIKSATTKKLNTAV